MVLLFSIRESSTELKSVTVEANFAGIIVSLEIKIVPITLLEQ